MPKAEQRFGRSTVARWMAMILIGAGLAPAKEAGRPLISWQPAKLVAGSPVLFRIVGAGGLESVSALWLGHDVNFTPQTGTPTWYGLAGVALETRPGSYELRVIEIMPGGARVEFKEKITVARRAYPRIAIKVAKQFTEPTPEQLQEIARDKELKHQVFGRATAEKLWAGPFLAPSPGAISDVFGTERVFNHEIQSRHLGLDYAVSAGTPVHAINRGVVVLARPLFLEGNCVVVDHGQGLLSLYLHLSEFKVKEGDQVSPGQLIALSGGTGRATGAHLHLAIRWQGEYLNPDTLLKLRMPSG